MIFPNCLWIGVIGQARTFDPLSENPDGEGEAGIRAFQRKGDLRQSRILAKRTPPSFSKNPWMVHGAILAGLALLAIWALGAPLFSGTEILSDRTADLAFQYLYTRGFGFAELAKGNLPFWNPSIYGGVPFLGDLQSALFYPPNWIFLVLPFGVAINWSMALQVFLLGAATYAWGLGRGLRPVAAGVGGAAAMFSGTFFLHLFAGHLTNLSAMPWAPVIFLGIDGWLKRRHAGWLLVAAVAVALQVFAGHPQYVYYTALVAGFYALVFLPGSGRLGQAAAGLLIIYPLGALLAAVQLLPGLAAAGESVRAAGVAYEFAAMFSFPPENLLTAVVPWFFGDMQTLPYWGRCYLWEMSLFAGAGVLLLAGQALLRPAQSSDRTRWLILLAGVVVLALGAHTPLHASLYHFLPGFSGFRGASKFIFFAGLFLALLAAMGFDRLLAGERAPRFLGMVAAAAGLVFLVTSWYLGGEAGEAVFRRMVEAVLATKESYLNPAALNDAGFLASLQKAGVAALGGAGALFVGYGVLLLAQRRWPAAGWMVAAAAVVEVFVFARGTTPHFPQADFLYQPVAEFLKQNPGDYRILNLINPDSTMRLQKEGLWGYDPSVLKRYAELMFISQGQDPSQASQNLGFQQPHPLLALLRGRFAFLPDGDEVKISPFPEPFPRFYLVPRYRVIADEGEMWEELAKPGLDLRQEVLLEEEPHPQPEGEGGFEISVREASTDHWIVEVATATPAILVQTDAYSKDWRVEALPGSVQTNYRILPANHAVRAIPLAAGRHLLRIEYVPSGFRMGLLISLAAWGAVAAVSTVRPWRRRLAFGSER